MHHAFEEQLPNAMRKAFDEIGLGEVTVDHKVEERMKPTVDIKDFDPYSDAGFLDVMALIENYPDYARREDAFRSVRHLVS